MKLFFRKSGDGKPLIILHGLFGMSDNWMSLSKQFAESGFLVYAVDARNHGRSPHAMQFNYSLMSEDLLQMMDEENIPSAAIIGHSMGGKTGMWLACSRPERVSKLIVADIAPRYYAPHHQGIIEAIHSIELNTAISRKEADSRLRETLHDEQTIQFLLKNLYWNEEEKLAWRFNVNAIERNISAVGVAIPEGFRFDGETLFLRGEKSGYITDSDKIEVQEHFPKASIETVANAGHWIHAENPKGFLEAVIKFLN